MTKAKNEVESKRAELAAKDKQLEELAEKIVAKLPKQFRLSDEDLDIPVGAIHAIKVEDGASIDPSRTRISNPAIVGVSYSSDNQVFTIVGRAPGQTSIKVGNKDGITSSVFVEVIGSNSVSSAQAVAGGIVNTALAEDQKIAYSFPADITADGVTSSAPHIASGRILNDRKWLIIEAKKQPAPNDTSDITVGLKREARYDNV